jgi:hypothetical protein
MARFAEILDVAKELGIPGGYSDAASYGVRMIIAGYAELTDIERTVLLLERHVGDIRVWDNTAGISIRIHDTLPNYVIVSESNSGSKNGQKTIRAISCHIRARSWTRCRDNSWFIKHLVPLWQKIYNEWIAI